MLFATGRCADCFAERPEADLRYRTAAAAAQNDNQPRPTSDGAAVWRLRDYLDEKIEAQRNRSPLWLPTREPVFEFDFPVIVGCYGEQCAR